MRQSFAKPETMAHKAIEQLKSTHAIQSLGTARNYEQCLKQCGEWLREQYGSRCNIANMSVKTAYAYLNDLSGRVSQKTLDMHRQAIQKVLQEYSHKLNGKNLSVIKSTAKTELKPRAYSAELVREIEKHQTERNAISTEIAYTAGLRAHELLTLRTKAENEIANRETAKMAITMRPDRPNQKFYADKFTGREGVAYVVTGKGGHVREVRLPSELAARLESRRIEPKCVIDRGIKYTQRFDIAGGSSWSRSVTRASVQAFGWSHGAHGLRHSYAQERLRELQQSGFTQDTAKRIVSLEMGHYREEITNVYLR